MTATAWGRSLADDAAAPQPTRLAGDGTFPDTPAPPQQMLAACPATNARPRNLTEYRAACGQAVGDVVELDAAAIQCGMVVWHFSAWRAVTDVVLDGRTVVIHMAADNGTASRLTSRETPVYRQAPR